MTDPVIKRCLSDRRMGRERLDGFKEQDIDREEKIETENQVFNGQFDVYATDAHTAFYVVTPVIMERLLAMKAKYGSFGVAVSGGEIAIALCSGFYLFEPPERYQEIENISAERSKDEIRQMMPNKNRADELVKREEKRQFVECLIRVEASQRRAPLFARILRQ